MRRVWNIFVGIPQSEFVYHHLWLSVGVSSSASPTCTWSFGASILRATSASAISVVVSFGMESVSGSNSSGTMLLVIGHPKNMKGQQKSLQSSWSSLFSTSEARQMTAQNSFLTWTMLNDSNINIFTAEMNVTCPFLDIFWVYMKQCDSPARSAWAKWKDYNWLQYNPKTSLHEISIDAEILVILIASNELAMCKFVVTFLCNPPNLKLTFFNGQNHIPILSYVK